MNNSLREQQIETLKHNISGYINLKSNLKGVISLAIEINESNFSMINEAMVIVISLIFLA